MVVSVLRVLIGQQLASIISGAQQPRLAAPSIGANHYYRGLSSAAAAGVRSVSSANESDGELFSASYFSHLQQFDGPKSSVFLDSKNGAGSEWQPWYLNSGPGCETDRHHDACRQLAGFATVWEGLSFATVHGVSGHAL